VSTVTITEFVASCRALLERVRRTGETVVITRRGEPVAQVVAPPAAAKNRNAALWGCAHGTGRILGDIVGPVSEPGDWEVLRE